MQFAKPSTRLQRRTSITVALFWSLQAACTKLESPNDRFGTSKVVGGSTVGGSSSAGDAPNTQSDGGARIEGPTGGDLQGAGTSSQHGVGGTAGGTATSILSEAAGRPCWDPSGFNGVGCLRCTPMSIRDFESACTTASCTPFDNHKRLSRLGVDGGLPALPQPQATGGNTGTGGTGNSAGTATAGFASTSAAGFAGANVSSAASGGTAAFTCDQLGANGKIVYVAGSSAAKPFLQQIAQHLSTQSVYIVYVSAGSCFGVEAALNRTLVTTGPAPAPATSAVYWDSITSSGKSCQMPLGGVTVDIGISDVFAQTCPGFDLASLDALQVKDAHGPIQTMAFVVPATSKYGEISAQAAYFVFGFGADGGVLDPDAVGPIWNDEAYVLTRSPTSGTQAMLAAAIGVPSTSWRGVPNGSSDALASALQTSLASPDTANKTIGILAVDYIDSKNLRPQIRILAFQDSNQPCAVYPDSTATARDKRNVRDGHYPIWSPLHLLHRADASGNPENPTNQQQIKDILAYLSGSKALPNGVRLMDVFAASGLIPECAMHVTRTKDGGNLAPFAPPSPCACAFELAATGSTTCKSCAVQGDCAATQSCSLGYCE